MARGEHEIGGHQSAAAKGGIRLFAKALVGTQTNLLGQGGGAKNDGAGRRGVEIVRTDERHRCLGEYSRPRNVRVSTEVGAIVRPIDEALLD